MADIKLKVCEETSKVVGPRQALVLEQVVMAPMGAGVCEGVTVFDSVEDGVTEGVALEVTEKDCVVDVVSVSVGVPVADGVPVGEALAVGVTEAVIDLVVVTVLEVLVVPEVVPLFDVDGVKVGVAESEDPADGVCESVVVAEHVGATLSPVDEQPAAQGHSEGEAEPAGQKEPTGQIIACALALPKGQ